MGRPFLYANSAYGEEGVIRAVSGGWHHSPLSTRLLCTWHDLNGCCYRSHTRRGDSYDAIVRRLQGRGSTSRNGSPPELLNCIRSAWFNLIVCCHQLAGRPLSRQVMTALPDAFLNHPCCWLNCELNDYLNASRLAIKSWFSSPPPTSPPRLFLFFFLSFLRCVWATWLII